MMERKDGLQIVLKVAIFCCASLTHAMGELVGDRASISSLTQADPEGQETRLDDQMLLRQKEQHPVVQQQTLRRMTAERVRSAVAPQPEDQGYSSDGDQTKEARTLQDVVTQSSGEQERAEKAAITAAPALIHKRMQSLAAQLSSEEDQALTTMLMNLHTKLYNEYEKSKNSEEKQQLLEEMRTVENQLPALFPKRPVGVSSGKQKNGVVKKTLNFLALNKVLSNAQVKVKLGEIFPLPGSGTERRALTAKIVANFRNGDSASLILQDLVGKGYDRVLGKERTTPLESKTHAQYAGLIEAIRQALISGGRRTVAMKKAADGAWQKAETKETKFPSILEPEKDTGASDAKLQQLHQEAQARAAVRAGKAQATEKLAAQLNERTLATENAITENVQILKERGLLPQVEKLWAELTGNAVSVVYTEKNSSRAAFQEAYDRKEKEIMDLIKVAKATHKAAQGLVSAAVKSGVSEAAVQIEQEALALQRLKAEEEARVKLKLQQEQEEQELHRREAARAAMKLFYAPAGVTAKVIQPEKSAELPKQDVITVPESVSSLTRIQQLAAKFERRQKPATTGKSGVSPRKLVKQTPQSGPKVQKEPVTFVGKEKFGPLVPAPKN